MRRIFQLKYKLVEIGQRLRSHNSSDFEILVCERDRERQEVGGRGRKRELIWGKRLHFS